MTFIKRLLQDFGYVVKERQGNEPLPQNTTPQQHTDDKPDYFPVEEKEQLPQKNQQSGTIHHDATDAPEDAFIHFFEKEMHVKNPPGLDYFEFRQQYAVMRDKMPEADPKIILNAVLAYFETNNVKAKDLLISASFYKGVLTDKKNVFLEDAQNEKSQILERRKEEAAKHNANIDSLKRDIDLIKRKLTELEQKLLQEQRYAEQAQTAGSGLIEKLDVTETKVEAACSYMLSAIEKDIAILSSAT